MLGALLPIVLNLAPLIGQWLGGDRGAAVAAQVGQAVSAVTGVQDTHTADGAAAVQAALAGKPELAAALQQRMIEIAAAQHQADLDAIKAANDATVASQASARDQTVKLAGMGSRLAYGAAVVSAAVIIGLVFVAYVVFTKAVPESQMPLALGVLESFKSLATLVVGYWCGSSFSSAMKNDALANSIPAQAAGGAATGPFAR